MNNLVGHVLYATWPLFFFGWWMFFIIRGKRHPQKPWTERLLWPITTTSIALFTTMLVASSGECLSEYDEFCVSSASWLAGKMDLDHSFIGFLHDWLVAFGYTIAVMQHLMLWLALIAIIIGGIAGLVWKLWQKSMQPRKDAICL